MQSILYPNYYRLPILFLVLLLCGTAAFAQSVPLFRAAADPALDRQIRQRDADLTAFRTLQLDAVVAGQLLGEQPATLAVQLPDPRGGAALELELERFDLLGADFSVTEMPANRPFTDLPEAVFYRGTVRDRPTSLAVLTVIDGAVSGLVSLPGESGELNLVRLDDTDAYLFYDDAEIEHKFSALDCEVLEPDDLPQPEPGKHTDKQVVDGCFGIFLDIGQTIYAERGGTAQAVAFLEEAFAQVATLYANEEISVTVSGAQVWTSREPFYDDLNQYRAYRDANNVDGSVAHYVHRGGGGGVAYLSALCNTRYGYGLSGIDNSYRAVPNYSWTVFVLTHELGHNFGSPHTHDCAWNGNDTPIDGCGSPYNGCGVSNEIPQNGGTLMSYCHLTSTGVNFTKGFGPQPGDRIRATAAAAPCKGYDCGTGTGGGSGGGGEVAVIPDGIYYLDARHSGKRLRPEGGSTTSGASIVQFRPRTLRSQEWNVTHLGGNVYRLVNEYSGHAIDVEGASQQAGANVVQWPYAGTANQQWSIEPVGGGDFYQLRATHSGQCLSVVGSSKRSDANVVQNPCTSAQNDDWIFVPVGSVLFDTPEATAALQLFPNPTEGLAHLRLQLAEDRGEGTITLSDARGRRVKEWTFPAATGIHELDIDLTERPAGLYIVRVQAGADTFVRRLLVTE